MGERRKISRFARAGFWLAAVAAVAAVLAGWGSRRGWWPFGLGFRFLSWSVVGASAAALLALIGLWATRRGAKRGRVRAMGALALALAVAAIPLSYLWKARNVPAIHDISTDTANPPAFSAVVPLRKGAPNPVEYGGPTVAEQQRAAYPDVQPAFLNVSPVLAFDRALEAARAMGWRIVEANPAQGRIEAVDTTRWFGFQDDVVVRVVPAEGGSRVDVRSLSRVGRSDVGANAKRIRAFLARLSRSS
jgi:uncharacterized protein (DUF1499 family)